MVQASKFVFSMTNDAKDNQVIVYMRNREGTLKHVNTFYTGGKGTGKQSVDPLMSQGSMILSEDGKLLFVVNAGSNTISSFLITKQGELLLQNVEPSGGSTPTCLALYDHILYVGNAGDPNNGESSNITGFELNYCGNLCRIPCATYSLSHPLARAACIVFHPNGDKLVVSEVTMNRLTVFTVQCDGTLTQKVVNDSNGAGPFGSIIIKNGCLLVTEAGAASLSSYKLLTNNSLHVISGSVVNRQSATCWISVNQNQQTAYTSNAGTNTISLYNINQDGSLMLRDNVKSNPNSDAAPLDNGVSKDGKNLYVLNGNEGTISVYRINEDGTLIFIEVFKDTGLPKLGAQGLAVL